MIGVWLKDCYKFMYNVFVVMLDQEVDCSTLPRQVVWEVALDGVQLVGLVAWGVEPQEEVCLATAQVVSLVRWVEDSEGVVVEGDCLDKTLKLRLADFLTLVDWEGPQEEGCFRHLPHRVRVANLAKCSCCHCLPTDLPLQHR